MKSSRFAIVLCLFILLLATVFLCDSHAATCPSVTAESVVIIDYQSGKIVYSKNRNKRQVPASTLKLLTAMVALDTVSESTRVSVSRKAALAQPSKIFIKQGETYCIGDLLKALLVSSANDAAVCIAEGVAGTEWKFAQKMTEKARALGCTNSHFANASGLPDPNNYTTAHDMARIVRESYKYPLIRDCLKSRYKTIRRPSGTKIALKNHNKLLWNYPIAVYGKTGYTRKAKHCFATVAQYNGRQCVVVMLRSTASWKDVRKLVAYGVGYNVTSSTAKKIYKNRAKHEKNAVIEIQRALKKAGCNPGKVDGVFGSQTLHAVMDFQKKHGLACDGIVGPQTLSVLQRFE